MDIYKFLLAHTVKITTDLPVVKMVYYSEAIWESDVWPSEIYKKQLQQGEDLGARMQNAFQKGFDEGFEKIIIIGSDMYDLALPDLELAFKQLEDHDFVVGPAADGGYYLLGMKRLKAELFNNKNWGGPTVFRDTISDLKDESHTLLEIKNDVDVYEDIQDITAFQPFLKHVKI